MPLRIAFQMDPIAGQINQYFSANAAPPQVQAAWQAFATIELQTADAIRAAGAQGGAPFIPVGVGPVATLADQLVGETSAFINAFAPTAGRDHAPPAARPRGAPA